MRSSLVSVGPPVAVRIARKAAGVRTAYESAGYRRLQGEREAAREGRPLCAYVPREERARVVAARFFFFISEDAAKRIRKRFIGSMLKDFNRIALSKNSEVASARREERAAQVPRALSELPSAKSTEN